MTERSRTITARTAGATVTQPLDAHNHLVIDRCLSRDISPKPSC
ncbi:hypothetical protein M2401_002248 [Pseudomonas sp. JUb42]|jgi:hypothetical protein|nr:hypothetical protein [Pseudomonas sp. JUb42]